MKTKPIIELAKVIRSKNAGPYELTFDFIFKDFDTYERVKNSNVINKEKISKLYKISKEDVLSVIAYDPAKAIKVTIVRPWASGAVEETDVYGAQQHTPLLKIKVPCED